MEISLCLLCERRGCLHICISMRGVARLPTYVFFGAKPWSVLWGKWSGDMEYLTGFERYVSCFLKNRLARGPELSKSAKQVERMWLRFEWPSVVA